MKKSKAIKSLQNEVNENSEGKIEIFEKIVKNEILGLQFLLNYCVNE